MPVSANIIGGIGNQLFIIGTAYSIAADNKDICAFNFNSTRRGQGNSPAIYRTNIYKKLQSLPSGWKPEFTYYEKKQYSPIPYHKNMLIDGYFSQLYFSHRKQEVIRLFKHPDILSKIKGQFNNSVSIHVRRGDYLKLPKFYIELQMSYYEKALSLLDKKTQIDRIYVLSDDINWCRYYFKDDRIDFIEGLPDYIDLYIMSLCKHNIMANSSFSWWGTYLNENPDKIVYCPEKWFGPKGPRQYEHLFCDNFIRL